MLKTEKLMKGIEILEKYWGYTSFRPLQANIVADVINGHDCLALLPTGGGKSICFQVPGIAREGMTIVISPLFLPEHVAEDDTTENALFGKLNTSHPLVSTIAPLVVF